MFLYSSYFLSIRTMSRQTLYGNSLYFDRMGGTKSSVPIVRAFQQITYSREPGCYTWLHRLDGGGRCVKGPLSPKEQPPD